MLNTDWLRFQRMIDLMETEFNGHMTFREAVFTTGLPLYYKGDTYVPKFMKDKLKAILPKGEEEQVYIIRRDNGTVEPSQH